MVLSHTANRDINGITLSKADVMISTNTVSKIRSIRQAMKGPKVVRHSGKISGLRKKIQISLKLPRAAVKCEKSLHVSELQLSCAAGISTSYK